MCVMLCLRSCDCPVVIEGSEGLGQWWISRYAVHHLHPYLQTLASPLCFHVHQPKPSPSCQHTQKPDPRAMQCRTEINVTDPDTLNPPICDWTKFAYGLCNDSCEAAGGKVEIQS